MNRTALIQDLEAFLKTLKLSNYEIRVYLTLLQASVLTAKELSRKTRVPSGRIYEVLDNLKEKGMIEIQETRPKNYTAISPNAAFNNLIEGIKTETQRKISSFFEKAKLLESKIDKSQLWVKQEAPGIFWSTAYGAAPVMDLYDKRLRELEKEMLMTGFLNKRTLKVLPYGTSLFKGVYNALKRGVKVKILWSFEFDGRPLSQAQQQNNIHLYNDFVKQLKEYHQISLDQKGLKMKMLHQRFPTYYDIFDKKRVIIKLQNPLKTNQFFAALNVLDLNLAKVLRDHYLTIWTFEAQDVS